MQTSHVHRILHLNLWSEIAKLFNHSTRRLAAIAYVTSDRVKFGKDDILVSDVSDDAIKHQQTNRDVIAAAVHRGAKVFSCDGLHAKILVLDQRAIVGSANLSASSANRLIEAAVLTDHPGTVALVTKLINDLAAKSVSVDRDFVSRIAKIKLAAPVWRGSHRAPNLQLESPTESRTWIIGVRELSPPFLEREEALSEPGKKLASKSLQKKGSSAEWIRWPSSVWRAKAIREGDTVVQLWCPLGSAVPVRVYEQVTVIRTQKEPRGFRIYVEESRISDARAISWQRFRQIIKPLQISPPVGRGSVRLLTAEQADVLWSSWTATK